MRSAHPVHDADVGPRGLFDDLGEGLLGFVQLAVGELRLHHAGVAGLRGEQPVDGQPGVGQAHVLSGGGAVLQLLFEHGKELPLLRGVDAAGAVVGQDLL